MVLEGSLLTEQADSMTTALKVLFTNLCQFCDRTGHAKEDCPVLSQMDKAMEALKLKSEWQMVVERAIASVIAEKNNESNF